MDDTKPAPAEVAAIVEAAVYAPPAFDPRLRWNGWAVTGICCVAFFFFVIAQTGMFLLLVPILNHPELLVHRLPGTPQVVPSAQLFVPLFTPGVLAATTIAGALVLFFVPLSLMNAALRVTLRDLGIGMRARSWQIAVGVLTGVALLVFSTLIQVAQTAVIGSHPQLQLEIMLRHHGTRAFALDLLSVCAFAPLGEEFFFRGVIFAAFAQRMPLAWAALVSGLIFGLAHFDLYNVAPLATIGIGLGYLYYRTRTLWPNIAAHATVNGISLIIVYLFPQFAK